jgi:hypothetical protein
MVAISITNVEEVGEEPDEEATSSVHVGAARARKPGGEPWRCCAAKVIGEAPRRGPRPPM